MGPLPRLLCVAAALASAFVALPTRGAEAQAPISAHAMLFSSYSPLAFKERVFAEAKALGANYVRADVEMSVIFKDPEHPDWRGLDEVVALSRSYGVPVLGILVRPPTHTSACPERGDYAYRCAIADTEEFGRLAGVVAAHAPAVRHWEIINEPDGLWVFEGGPENYGRALGAASRHIRRRAPAAQILLGGLMSPTDANWVGRALGAAGSTGVFDIANVHLRGRAIDMGPRFTRSRELLRSHGFHGDVWVTEHGYPADRAFQGDAAFRGGEPAQAAYLSRSVISLASAGAGQVFVTLRDNDTDFAEYRAEGIVRIERQGAHAVRRKPAFFAVRRLVDGWAFISQWERERLAAEGSARVEELRAAASRQRWRREIVMERGSATAARRAQRRSGGRVSCSRRARLPRRAAKRRLHGQTCLLRAAGARHGRHVRTHLIRAHVAQRAAGRQRARAMRLQGLIRSAAG